MAAVLPPTVQAGRLLQLLGWISITLLVFLVLISTRSSGSPAERFIPVELLFGFLIYSVLCLIAGAAIKKSRLWGKALGASLCVVSLPYFPFGTLLGVWTLIYLYRGRTDPPEI